MASGLSVGAVVTLLALMQRYDGYVSLSGGDCGRGQLQGRQARVVGGSAAQHGQYPWLVSVQLRRSHLCGGSIISRRLVITAAHCLHQRRDSDLSVLTGEHDLTQQERSQRRYTLRQSVVHVGYRYPSFSNDVALLLLDQPLAWTDFQQPVCLPRPDEQLEAGRQAVVAGWGWLDEIEKGGRRADVLQHVSVPIQDTDTCQQWFREAGKKLVLRRGQICAGLKQGGRDGCRGDSGGPMVVEIAPRQGGRRQVQLGVVSAGIGCGRPHLPGIYTDLRQYMVWITEQAKKLDNSVDNGL